MKSDYTGDNNINNDTNNKKVLILYENDKNNKDWIIKMEIMKKGYLFDITEFILAKNYTLKDALDILMTKLLTNINDK